jgi:YidC/Oxa1 family membrane protein insertase
LLIQMPILFALYAALVALGPYFVNANFFWIPDLGFPHYSKGMGWISEYFNQGNYLLLLSYLILPALLVATQFVMQKWMTTTTPSSGDGQAQMMSQMSLMMTFMFGFFTLSVPAGLTLYWVTSNLLQMLQQWLITSNRFNLGSASAVTASTPATTQITASAKPVKVTSNGSETNAASITPGVAQTQPDKGTPAKARKSAKSKGK